MKKIETPIINTMYEASDGKLFRFERECLIYEAKLLEKKLKKFDIKVNGVTRYFYQINSKEELLLIADYNNKEKNKLTFMIRILFLVGLISMVVYLFIHNINEIEFFSQFLLGIIFAVLLIGLLFTTKYMIKIRELKLRLLNRKRGGSKND